MKSQVTRTMYYDGDFCGDEKHDCPGLDPDRMACYYFYTAYKSTTGVKRFEQALLHDRSRPMRCPQCKQHTDGRGD